MFPLERILSESNLFQNTQKKDFKRRYSAEDIHLNNNEQSFNDFQNTKLRLKNEHKILNLKDSLAKSFKENHLLLEQLQARISEVKYCQEKLKKIKKELRLLNDKQSSLKKENIKLKHLNDMMIQEHQKLLSNAFEECIKQDKEVTENIKQKSYEILKQKQEIEDLKLQTEGYKNKIKYLENKQCIENEELKKRIKTLELKIQDIQENEIQTTINVDQQKLNIQLRKTLDDERNTHEMQLACLREEISFLRKKNKKLEGHQADLYVNKYTKPENLSTYTENLEK